LRTLVKAELYPYQAEGALFAARAGCCLIGDEMGLGKTIQAIAATELFARHFGAERVLIVCPTSLKHQWQKEIARFTGRQAQVIGGLRAARLEQYAEHHICGVQSLGAVAWRRVETGPGAGGGAHRQWQWQRTARHRKPVGRDRCSNGPLIPQAPCA
jgi:hypothetical protein